MRQQVAYAAAGFRQASIRANSIVHRAERIVAMAPKVSPPGRPPADGNNEPGLIISDTNADSQQRRTIRNAHQHVPDDQFDAMLARAAETGEPLTRKAIADAGKQNAKAEAQAAVKAELHAAAGFRQASIRANSIVHRAERIVAMAPKRPAGKAPSRDTYPEVSISTDTPAEQKQRSVIRNAHANVPADQFDAMLARAGQPAAPRHQQAGGCSPFRACPVLQSDWHSRPRWGRAAQKRPVLISGQS